MGSFGQGGDDFIKDGATCNTNIKKCHRKVKDGHFTTAVKLLPSSGVAPYCDDTSKALEVKNPYKPPPSMPSITFFEPPLVVEIDSVFGCIKLFPKDLLKVITSIVNMWLAGRCPHILTKFIAYAPLTPLFKTDNEIRPIAVGTIWRRLVSKLAMKANKIVFGDTHTWSATRLQQSDSLGPLLFALILNSLVHKIKDSCKLLLHIWYLDDVTVIGYSEEVASVLDIIKASGPGLGLELDIKKTEICWSSCNGLKLREGLFHVDIRRSSSDVKLLGGVLLPLLRDPQSELPLLQSCMGIAKLFFGLRTCQPVHMEDAALFFDKCFRVSIENIVVCGGPFLETYSGDLLLYPFDLVVWVYTQQKWFPPMLLWPRRPNLGCYKTTSHMTVAYVVWMMIMFMLWLVFLIRFHALILAISLIKTPSPLKPNKHQRVGISAKKKALVNFLTDPLDGRSTLRPANVLVFGWLEGNMR
ncbi:putative reverse transcriptase domain-containing protein [Tanacetum coccineum]